MKRLIFIILALFLISMPMSDVYAQNPLMKVANRGNAKQKAKTSKATKTTKTTKTPSTSSSSGSLRQQVSKAKRNQEELKRMAADAYEDIQYSRSAEDYRQYLSQYPKSEYARNAKDHLDEITLWENARNTNTVKGYKDYLEKSTLFWYRDDANSSISQIEREQQRVAWEKVRDANSIETYELYLKNNPNSAYKEEAMQNLNKLKGEREWARIKEDGNIEEFQNYLVTYPKSDNVKDAEVRVYELTGVRHYNLGDMGKAYDSFIKLKKSQMKAENHSAYDEVMEHHDFSKLTPQSSEMILQQHLKKYPNGKYAVKVSNMMAVAKGRLLNLGSTESDYELVRSYAKDAATKQEVENYITSNKKAISDNKKYLKKQLRRENGGLVSFGWELLDLGFNMKGEDETAWYYNMGLYLRIGNYADRVQFALGVQPGLFGFKAVETSGNNDSYKDNYNDYDYDYGYDTSGESEAKGKVKFHMPVIGRLKVNILPLGSSCWWYAMGQYQYNAIRVKDVEGSMGWGAGIGFAWKKFDWSFYYRGDLTAPDYPAPGSTYVPLTIKNGHAPKQNFIGTSMTVYF